MTIDEHIMKNPIIGAHFNKIFLFIFSLLIYILLLSSYSKIIGKYVIFFVSNTYLVL